MTHQTLKQPAPRNTILHGDCIEHMRALKSGSVDFILTDPPYLTRYRDRTGRTVRNDDNASWLAPSFAEMYRVLKPHSFCVSFYGWNKAELFIDAWRKAGFRICGHMVFRKTYASGGSFLRSHHEQAYLLVKGRPAEPAARLPDVIDFPYTGNRLHPTQKPVASLRPIIESFTKPGDLVLDPFCGSGSTLVAAHETGRDFLGIELDGAHHQTATLRVLAA